MQPTSNSIKAAIAARALRLLRHTWRTQFINKAFIDDVTASDRRFLVCFWHGEYIPIFPILEDYKATVISNESLRGEVIAGICRNFGYQVARIPDETKRGSLLKLAKILSVNQVAATPVDGPLGPYREVKLGLVLIAARLGFELLPVAVGSHRKLILKKRWDKLEIPLPFTRVYLNFGKPIRLPSHMKPVELKNQAENLAEIISNLEIQINEFMYSTK